MIAYDTLIEDVHKIVAHTITHFKLCSVTDRICVAVSGGKDSQVLLVVLKTLGYNVEGLLIDEGIAGYREKTIVDMQALCDAYKVPLRIVSYKQEVGKSLDEIMQQRKGIACTVCGTFRRYYLNKYASSYDAIATGHNIDDEAQAILLNIISGQPELLVRLGPQSGTQQHKGFTKRIKPLYFLSEKQIRAYAFLKKLHIQPDECPYAPMSLRAKVRDWLNAYEYRHPGTKKHIVEWLLEYKQTQNVVDSEIKQCSRCGAPSHGEVCKACLLKDEINRSV
ncbi:MAG: TIGR00269 family protein [Candidatus Woesearchaeota archaeon]